MIGKTDFCLVHCDGRGGCTASGSRGEHVYAYHHVTGIGKVADNALR